MSRLPPPLRLVLCLALLGLAGGGCRDRSQDPGEPGVVRLGFLPNVTHAQALTGLTSGRFAAALPGISLDAKAFSSGPALIEALFAGEVDVAYLGPSPAINGYVRSKGRALTIISGAAAGGCRLVTRRELGVRGAGDLRGRRVGVPQIGNTQDVMFRAWLGAQGLASTDRGGDVHVYPLANADILALMVRKELDAAYVAEPWGARLLAEADAEVYAGPDGPADASSPVTVVVARRAFLEARRADVMRFLAAHRAETEWHRTHPDAPAAVNAALKQLVGKSLPPAVLADALGQVTLTTDLRMDALDAMAESAFTIGYLPTRTLDGILLPPSADTKP